MRTSCFLAFFLFTSFIFSQESKVTIDGELKKWNKITLSFQGDHLTESDEYNPFLNYRLNVTFKNKNKSFVVPGFFAADGNASETSAKAGNVWKVRFIPDEIGEWSYSVSFRKGESIAINEDEDTGESVGFDGLEGVFNIAQVDKKESNIRAKGRLEYTGDRYLRYAETNEAFLKGGADSPENFLAYFEFDNTPASHKYEPHAKDWRKDNPVWQDGKGKNIIGALNYLAQKGMNSVYFLTMNVQGDGKDVFPWTSKNERYRFDCSKLDQWEVVFDHMDDLGLMLHIVTQETENELLLDIGQLGVQRKLYYRELIARFSHHLAITWNLGEENGPVHWSPKGQDDNDRKAMAKYIKEQDPYKNFIALHSHSLPKEQEKVFNPLLNYNYLDGVSNQIFEPESVHDITKKWIKESQNTNRKWVVTQDEIGPADVGAKPDKDDPSHDEVRGPVLWGNLMAGGAGVEWYFGYKYDHMDLNCEDWRSRDILWDQTRYALDFFKDNLPYSEMNSADHLTRIKSDYVFAKEGEVYAIYMPKVEKTKLNLKATNAIFSVKWFNPNKGGELLNGTIKTIEGGKNVFIGFPPDKEKDWVALVKKKREAVSDKEIRSKVISIKEALKNAVPFEENNGFIEVEAEAFQYNSNNGTKRDWYIRTSNDESNVLFKNITENHSITASGSSYIEALPDTRITHDDPLIHGENFFPIQGLGGVVSYKLKFNTPGIYYVWASAFSNGSEDNGVHVGLDGEWPETGARMQWCEGKNKWTWSSAQRKKDNHCGVPNTISLNIKKTGEYIISFSMREDGFEMDRWIMTKNINFIPE